ncbi:hypothetical protein [Paenibacillus sp. MSJ-34]|uniref:hypothetical protein n=1 Tax=Paenibacillus sp. MSJ-34 TaxID=2841529 RepID=UPI001C117DF7|nr:hypothetical protein [Paenibacillus sp. MSJ-34]MBU5441214.1 hypothetical protein [Paenibacillus sp. MSJ-34]
MTPTSDLREELRELLDEEIPLGGTEADTAFTDAQLNRMLNQAPNIYAAAAEGWRRKAAKIQKRLGDIVSYQTGAEQYERVDLSKALAASLKMAETFDGMADKTGSSSTGSFMFQVKRPEVF